MGLFSFLLGISQDMEKENKRRRKSLEDEMDIYGLSDDEKEIVRRGDQDPWDFDEDDIEEGDYYEDD